MCVCMCVCVCRELESRLEEAQRTAQDLQSRSFTSLQVRVFTSECVSI